MVPAVSAATGPARLSERTRHVDQQRDALAAARWADAVAAAFSCDQADEEEFTYKNSLSFDIHQPPVHNQNPLKLANISSISGKFPLPPFTFTDTSLSPTLWTGGDARILVQHQDYVNSYYC